jgi:hypothetical protein
MLSRADVLKGVLLALPASRLAPLPASASVLQADDKSFDLTLPATWAVQGTPPRAEFPRHLFAVRAARYDGAATLTLTVDQVDAKSLSEFGSVDAVGRRLLAARGPSARLVRAEKVAAPGPFASATYAFAFEVGADAPLELVRLGLKQRRLYTLELALRSGEALLREEAEAIAGSYRVFPLNLGCLAQSNRGQPPLPAICY